MKASKEKFRDASERYLSWLATKVTLVHEDVKKRHKTLAEIERTRIGLPTGGAIFLRDVATVIDTIKSERSLARINKSSSLGIQVVKQA